MLRDDSAPALLSWNTGYTIFRMGVHLITPLGGGGDNIVFTSSNVEQRFHDVVDGIFE